MTILAGILGFTIGTGVGLGVALAAAKSVLGNMPRSR